MRISDWSSDVCSSDLMHVHVATSSARYKPNRRGGHGASGGGVNTAPTLRYAAAPNQKTEESRCGASYSGATGNWRSWTFPTRRPARARWCWRSRHRSEEHTSELQSLMRISYAVFCLKKKKKKNKRK